jgi:hypothetical protein
LSRSRAGPSASKRITELEQEIDRLQRTEEAIVVATGVQPWVVLGVKGRRGARRPRRVMARWQYAGQGRQTVCVGRQILF